MRNTFFTLIFSLLLVSYTSSNAEETSSAALTLKVGYVNVDYIIQSMPEREAVDAELNTFYGQLTKQIQAKVQEMKEKHATFQQKEKLTEQDQIALQKLEQELQQFDQESQKRLRDKRVSLYQPLYEKVTHAITQIAQAHGYTYVLNERGGGLIYADDAHDLSSLVFKKLGLTPQEENA